MNNIEKWMDIIGYEGLYQVSNRGNVRSLDRWRNNGTGVYKQKGIILSQSNTSTGYKKVELSKDGNRRSFKTHRLVAIAFIENIDNKPHVNHIDGNPINNNVKNLEWCTQKENVIHSYETGLKNRNIIDKELLEKSHYNKKMTIKEIAEMLGLTNIIVTTNMKRYGLEIKKWSKYKLTKEFIINELKNKTQKQIANEAGCDQSLISKILNKEEITYVK